HSIATFGFSGSTFGSLSVAVGAEAAPHGQPKTLHAKRRLFPMDVSFLHYYLSARYKIPLHYSQPSSSRTPHKQLDSNVSSLYPLNMLLTKALLFASLIVPVALAVPFPKGSVRSTTVSLPAMLPIPLAHFHLGNPDKNSIRDTYPARASLAAGQSLANVSSGRQDEAEGAEGAEGAAVE
ncbi:hypothetical protein GGX14DRAFT_655082, partial [Mycena pura]